MNPTCTGGAAAALGARGRRGLLYLPQVQGLVDQALVSGGSLLSGLLMARWTGVEDYQAYVVGFSLLMLFNALQTLFTVPLAVYGAGEATSERRAYLTRTCMIALVAFAMCGALVSAGSFSYAMLAHAGGPVWKALPWVGFGVAAYLTQTLCRVALYARHRIASALVNDAIVLTGHFATVVLLHKLQCLNASTVWLSIAGWWFLGVALALVALRKEFLFRPGDAGRVLRQNLNYGQWAAATAGATYLMTFMNVLILALVSEKAAAARMEAGRMILQPLYVLYTGLANYYISHGAREMEKGGPERMHAVLWRPWLLLMLVACIYAILTSLYAEPLLRLVYKGRYDGQAPVVRLWAFYYVALMASWLPVVAFWVLRRPKLNFMAKMGCALFTFSAAWPYAAWQGAAGVLKVMAVSNALYAVALFVIYLRARRTQDAVPDGLFPAAVSDAAGRQA